MFQNTNDIIEKFTSPQENKQTDYLRHENSNYVYSLPLLRHNLTNHAEEEFLFNHILPPRSEERRVGKECRARWAGSQGRKKREREYEASERHRDNLSRRSMRRR